MDRAPTIQEPLPYCPQPCSRMKGKGQRQRPAAACTEPPEASLFLSTSGPLRVSEVLPGATASITWQMQGCAQISVGGNLAQGGGSLEADSRIAYTLGVFDPEKR